MEASSIWGIALIGLLSSAAGASTPPELCAGATTCVIDESEGAADCAEEGSSGSGATRLRTMLGGIGGSWTCSNAESQDHSATFIGSNIAGVNLAWGEGEGAYPGLPNVRWRYITLATGLYWDHAPLAGIGFCWCEGEGFQGPHCTVYLSSFNAATGYRDDAIPCPLGPMLPDQPRLPWGEMLP